MGEQSHGRTAVAGHRISGRLLDEDPVKLADIAQVLPGRPSYKSLTQYSRIGRVSRSGVVVKLETIIIGTLCTSRAAFLRFIAAVNEIPEEAGKDAGHEARRTRGASAAR